MTESSGDSGGASPSSFEGSMAKDEAPQSEGAGTGVLREDRPGDPVGSFPGDPTERFEPAFSSLNDPSGSSRMPYTPFAAPVDAAGPAHAAPASPAPPAMRFGRSLRQEGGPEGNWSPFWRGTRLIDPRATDGDRILCAIAHLWWLGFFLGLGPFAAFIPVGIWIVRQSSSGFVDDHVREVLNSQLTGILLVLSIVGVILVPFWLVATAIHSLRGAVAAAQREHFRYGTILRPIG